MIPKLTSWLVVSNIFYVHPYLGKIPILTNMFQRGWNHQPTNICFSYIGAGKTPTGLFFRLDPNKNWIEFKKCEETAMKLAKTVSTGYVRDGFQDLASCGGSSHAETRRCSEATKKTSWNVSFGSFFGPGSFCVENGRIHSMFPFEQHIL